MVKGLQDRTDPRIKGGRETNKKKSLQAYLKFLFRNLAFSIPVLLIFKRFTRGHRLALFAYGAILTY